MEERPAEEELEGALVHLKAQQLVLLHRGGPQGVSRQHSFRWELLCGGEQLEIFPTPLTQKELRHFTARCAFGSGFPEKQTHFALLPFVTLKSKYVSMQQRVPNCGWGLPEVLLDDL